MKRLTVGSLFSGIGGIDLGLERAGMEVRWHSEIDPYASRVLAKHWPGVPNHGDITQIDFAAVEPVDVLAGGFPCQDLSNAGKRAGIDGERSGLWSEYVRAIRDVRPRYVLVENVTALLSGGDGDWFARVLGDLASLRYDAEWECIPASAVGAPHGRDRVWVVAYPQHRGLAERWGAAPARAEMRDVWRVRGNERQSGSKQAREVVARVPRIDTDRIHATGWEAEPGLARLADGVPHRVQRTRGAGNAVVPQIPELIGGWIIEHARATGYLEAA